MAITASGSRNLTENLLVDICEGWNGFHNLLSGNPQGQLSDARMLFDPMAGGSTNSIFPGGGTGSLLSYDLTVGRTSSPWTSAAGITTLAGAVGSGSFGIPLGLRFALAASVSPSIWPRPFRRYRVDYLARGIVGPGAADYCVGIVSNVAGCMPTGGSNEPFFAWVARGALNAGNWTPRFRLAVAGAIVDGADSGIPFIEAPARVRQLSIVYEEGLIPVVRWLLDNREVHQLSGDGNMMSPNGSIFLAKAMGATVGVTQVQQYETRYRVWEI